MPGAANLVNWALKTEDGACQATKAGGQTGILDSCPAFSILNQ